MLNAISSENFVPTKIGRFWGSGGQGFQKVAICTPKGTSLREPTSFEPFCVEGCDLQVGSGKKPRK